jgi:GT2 family glycosyltransferase
MNGRATALTRGNLPVTVVQNLEPTAVGRVDLGRSIAPSSPDGRAFSGNQRDCLLLIRLHGEPLGVVHIERDLSSVAAEELAAEIWRLTGPEIRRHCERYRCADVPKNSVDLLGDSLLPAERCAGDELPEIVASVAVILSTIGQEPAQLERCIRSLLTQRRAEFEIVVVDNRPTMEKTRHTVGRLAADDPRVRYVAEPRAGLSVARNRGLSETDAELVAFTDDDVVADPHWLEWLLAPFNEPGVAVACGMVLPLELQTEAQKRFEQYLGFSRGVQRHSYDRHTGQIAGLPLYPFLADIFGSGNSMAFRRADLIASGGFDPALGAGSPARAGEETDAFSTAILRGGRIVYEPRALCWHEHRKDGDALRDQIFGYGAGVGALVTKGLTSDRRFYRAAASRPISTLLGRRVRGRVPADTGTVGAESAADRPEELLRARRQGIMRGPLLYAQGVLRSRRLGLRDVIRGG